MQQHWQCPPPFNLKRIKSSLIPHFRLLNCRVLWNVTKRGWNFVSSLGFFWFSFNVNFALFKRMGWDKRGESAQFSPSVVTGVSSVIHSGYNIHKDRATAEGFQCRAFFFSTEWRWTTWGNSTWHVSFLLLGSLRTSFFNGSQVWPCRTPCATCSVSLL